MRVRLVLLVLLAGCTVEITAEDCLPTLGDHCSCDPKCMTQAQIDAIDDFCDLGCPDGTDWECTVVDNECVVAD